ncbi:MAG: hypothetical protein ACYTBX_17430 [Planctomycetota bacterium]
MSENDSVANANGQGPGTIMRSGGKDYVLAPLRMEDLGDVERFAKEVHRQEILDLMKEAGELMDQEERTRWLKELKEDLSGTISKQDLEDTVEGTRWTWMSEVGSPIVISYAIKIRLRKTYPEMTDEQASDIITADAIADMKEEMGSLLGLDAFSSSAEDGEESQGEAPGA